MQYMTRFVRFKIQFKIHEKEKASMKNSCPYTILQMKYLSSDGI